MKYFGFIALSFLFVCESKMPVTKVRSDCDKWAEDGDCSTNSGFMWSSCHTSCMNIAQDMDDKCDQWAEEGQCTSNPEVVHVQCPLSCQQAIGWSPWVRVAARIPESLPFDESFHQNFSSCLSPVDLVGAASVVKSQISLFLEGGARMTPGLVTSSPNEYMGMLGLTEAILYAMRLYDLDSKIVIDALTNAKSQTRTLTTTLKAIKKSHDKIKAGYIEILTTIATSGTSDLLMRSIPIWYKYLDEASIKSTVLSNEYKKAFPDEIPKVTACPSPRGPSLSNLATINTSYKQTESLPVNPTITLSNGHVMPTLGLGTWQLEGPDFEDAIVDAIRMGYRHIDTAEGFRNEASVGWAVSSAIQKGYVDRKDLFISTKISDEASGGYSAVKRLVKQQLQFLKTDYIDLYIIHSPFEDKHKQGETWRALEEFVDEGRIRSLGLCNFQSREVEEFSNEVRIKPVVVQAKVDVYHIGKQVDSVGDKLVAYAKRDNIAVVAYSSLSGYPFAMKPIEDPVVKYIASSRGHSPAQVILRWLLQHGVSVLPRTSNLTRMKENFDVLKMTPLSIQEMELLDRLQYLVENPANVPVLFTASPHYEL